MRKYKEAVLEYTAGIKESVDDVTLNAVMYTNRAAANFHLGEVLLSVVSMVELFYR